MSEEADAAVGEEEVGPAAVQAPEVVAVARVVEPTGAEVVARAAAAVVQVEPRLAVTQVAVRPRERVSDDVGVPNPRLERRRRRPLTRGDGLAGAVGHVGEADAGALAEAARRGVDGAALVNGGHCQIRRARDQFGVDRLTRGTAERDAVEMPLGNFHYAAASGGDGKGCTLYRSTEFPCYVCKQKSEEGEHYSNCKIKPHFCRFTQRFIG